MKNKRSMVLSNLEQNKNKIPVAHPSVYGRAPILAVYFVAKEQTCQVKAPDNPTKASSRPAASSEAGLQ
jgi:hypothetical protein